MVESKVFNFSQNYLGINQEQIEATVLIETITASFQLDEILYELKSIVQDLTAEDGITFFLISKNLETIQSF